MLLKKAIFLVLCLSSSTVMAVESKTLKKIKDNNTIVLAVRENSIPFSFVDNNGDSLGYSVEICEKIARQIKKINEISQLKIVYMPIQSAERIDIIEKGIADLECGVTSISNSRLKKIDFSIGFYLAETRFISPKKIEIKSLDSLNDYKIAVVSSSVAEKHLQEQLSKNNYKYKLIPYKDSKEAILSVLSGTSDAHTNDDVLLTTQLLSNNEAKEKLHLTGNGFLPNTFGIGLPKNDKEFKKQVDDVIKELIVSGELNKLYNKWFLMPIPPKSLNMNLNMSDSMKKYLESPSDKALID